MTGSYSPTSWVDGNAPAIDAANLNKLENAARDAYTQAHGVFNVKDVAYGAKGDGTTDDTAAIQAAITAAGAGIVCFPVGQYKVSSSLTPVAGSQWVGGGYHDRASLPTPPVQFVAANGFASPLVNAGAGVVDVSLVGIGFSGSGAVSGCKGVHAVDASGWRIIGCFFDQFGDQGIVFDGGQVPIVRDVWLQNCVLVRTGRADYVGALDISSTDGVFDGVNATTSSSSVAASGFISGIVVRSANNFFNACVGQISESGIVVTSAAAAILNRFVNCRTDLNYGHGFVIAGSETQVSNCTAYRNGQGTDNTYDGFSVTGASNIFTNCIAMNAGGDTNQMRYGFNDTSTSGANLYDNNKGLSTRSGAFKTGTSAAIAAGSTVVGSGSPETVISAAVGAHYRRTDGGAATSFYVKESGTGNTGWVAK